MWCRQHTHIRWISKRDATAAASILLGRDDIKAVYIAPNKLTVWPCNGHKLERPASKGESRDSTVFKSGLLPSAEEERINMALRSLSMRSKIISFPSRTQTQGNLIEEARNEGERLLQEIDHQVDITANAIEKKLSSIATHWSCFHLVENSSMPIAFQSMLL